MRFSAALLSGPLTSIVRSTQKGGGSPPRRNSTVEMRPKADRRLPHVKRTTGPTRAMPTKQTGCLRLPIVDIRIPRRRRSQRFGAMNKRPVWDRVQRPPNGRLWVVAAGPPVATWFIFAAHCAYFASETRALGRLRLLLSPSSCGSFGKLHSGTDFRNDEPAGVHQRDRRLGIPVTGSHLGKANFDGCPIVHGNAIRGFPRKLSLGQWKAAYSGIEKHPVSEANFPVSCS